MDLSTWAIVAVIAWTVLGLVLVAVLWPRSPWKAVLAWLGIALLPLGLLLVGLSEEAIDGWNTLAIWWQNLVLTVPVIIGLSVLGLAVGLLVLSRFVPTRSRKRAPKQPTQVPPADSPPSYGPPMPPSSAEDAPAQPDQRQYP